MHDQRRDVEGPSGPHRPSGNVIPEPTTGSVASARLFTRASIEHRLRPVTVGFDFGTSATTIASIRDGRPLMPFTRHAGRVPRLTHGLPASSSVHLGGLRPKEHRLVEDADGNLVSFHQVASTIFKEARQLAEVAVGQAVHGAVITIPAFYGDTQRDEVLRAAEDAQLHVIRVVSKPVAAMFGIKRQLASRSRVIVLDLGLAAFEATVLEVRDLRVSTVANAAVVRDVDADEIVALFLRESFAKIAGARLDPTPAQMARLRGAAQECRLALVSSPEHTIHLRGFAEVDGRPRDLEVTISREMAFTLVQPVATRVLQAVEALLVEHQLTPASFDNLVLLGEGMLWPGLRDRIEGYFGRRAEAKLGPDQLASFGAAGLADELGPMELSGILPSSIGFGGRDGRFYRLVPKNAKLPAVRRFVVSTFEDDQRTYTLPLYQGESADASSNEYMGTLVIEGIPPEPRGSRTLELTLHVDEACVMTADAVDAATGAPMPTRVTWLVDAESRRRELDARPAAGSPRGAANTFAELASRVRRLLAFS